MYLYNHNVKSLYNKSTHHINTFLSTEEDDAEKSKKLCINSTITINIIITKDEFISLNSREKGSKVILVPVLIHQDSIIHSDYNELIIYDAKSLEIDNVSTKFSYVKGNVFIIDNNMGKIVIKGAITKSIDYYGEPQENQSSNKKCALISKDINIVSNITLNNLDKDTYPNSNFKITISKVNILDEIKIKK